MRLLPPPPVPLREQQLHLLTARTVSQLLIVQPISGDLGGIGVGMSGVPTTLTTERLLGRTIAARDMMTAMTFLGGIRALDLLGTLLAFQRAPGELAGKVRQVGGIQVGVHPPTLEPHGP